MKTMTKNVKYESIIAAKEFFAGDEWAEEIFLRRGVHQYTENGLIDFMENDGSVDEDALLIQCIAEAAAKWSAARCIVLAAGSIYDGHKGIQFFMPTTGDCMSTDISSNIITFDVIRDIPDDIKHYKVVHVRAHLLFNEVEAVTVSYEIIDR